jgi:alcohol dehydrogenase (NADP+)
VVSIIQTIEQCAASRHPVDVDDAGFALSPPHSSPAIPNPQPATLPAIGFGCSRYRGGNTYVDLEDAIVDALDMGVRLLDGAELYGTEPLIGDILQRPGSPPREALYLISKAWNTNHAPEHLTNACRASREALGVDTLDCYMLHWPDAWQHTEPLAGIETLSHDDATTRTFPTDEHGDPLEANVDLKTTWRAMEALVERGWTRHLGVSNFERDGLEQLLAFADVPPAINQIACHPYAPRTELVNFCQQRGLRVMAHSPLSTEGLLDDPTLQSIATEHGASTAQVVLRWLIQRDIVPIPSSTSRTHIADNLDVFQFTLSDEAMERIGGLRLPATSR